jgi:hypothetical protein
MRVFESGPYGDVLLIWFEWLSLAIRAFERFKANETRYFVAVTADIPDFESFSDFPGDPIEGLVCMFFRKGRPPPFKKTDQGPAQVFILLTGPVPIQVETC